MRGSRLTWSKPRKDHRFGYTWERADICEGDTVGVEKSAQWVPVTVRFKVLHSNVIVLYLRVNPSVLNRTFWCVLT